MKITEQYYLHSFLPQQPDLNWFNPEVRRAIDQGDSVSGWTAAPTVSAST